MSCRCQFCDRRTYRLYSRTLADPPYGCAFVAIILLFGVYCLFLELVPVLVALF